MVVLSGGGGDSARGMVVIEIVMYTGFNWRASVPPNSSMTMAFMVVSSVLQEVATSSVLAAKGRTSKSSSSSSG